jgi:hypothetical protein
MTTRWKEFQQCPGCGYDLGSGEGERACSWGECSYLPDELDVFCEQCRFNFLTMEGNPSCDDPMRCEHAAAPIAHVVNYRQWAAARAAEAGHPSAQGQDPSPIR